MDISTIKKVISIEVSDLDLAETDIGQVVTVVTNKGTFWVARLKVTSFHGQVLGTERIAVWGTDLTSTNPMDTSCTRVLGIGKEFVVKSAGEETVSQIEHILMPVRDQG
jgi:hypothetical protein